MSEEPFILDFDANLHAVLEPDRDQLPYHFHSRLLYAFVPKKILIVFLMKCLIKYLELLTPFLFNRQFMKSILMVNC